VAVVLVDVAAMGVAAAKADAVVVLADVAACDSSDLVHDNIRDDSMCDSACNGVHDSIHDNGRDLADDVWVVVEARTG
jgi:hypothetical protein